VKLRPPAVLQYLRYGDDLVVLLRGGRREATIAATEVMARLRENVENSGLQLSPTKTGIFRPAQGFDFLGVNLRLVRGKVRRTPTQDRQVNTFNHIDRLIRKYRRDGFAVTYNQVWRALQARTEYHRQAGSDFSAFGEYAASRLRQVFAQPA